MTDISALEAWAGQVAVAAEKSTAAAGKQHEYVNGSATTDVLTESGLVPSLAKQAVQGQEKVAAVLTEVASQLAGAATYDTTELGLLKTVDGSYFSTPSPASKGYLISWRNTAGVAVYQDTYPNAKAVEEIGIEEQSTEVSGLAFAVVDDAGRRTWLEAGKDGAPSAYAAEKIGASLTEENAPVLVESITAKAVAESVDEVGIEVMPALNEQLAFAVVDDEGRRTWLEAGKDGAPSAYAAEKIGASLTEENAPALAESIATKAVTESVDAVGIEPLSALNDSLSFAIVDEDGRRTWLEADLDGNPTQHSIEAIVEKLPGGLGEAPSTYQSGVKGVLNIVSGIKINGFGDSMTAGAGGGGTNYLGELQRLLTEAGHTIPVINRGVGGENSVTICARAGGNPFVVLPVAGVIPATTTAFEITLQAINGYVPKPLMQGPSSYTGRLGNVPGTFSRTVADTVYTYYFTRATAGAEIVANRPLPLYLDIGDQARGDINIIWIGQNGPNDVRAIQDAKAIIQRMTALDKRYLVISKPGGSSTSDVDDAMWFAEFGRRFIPIRQYMVKYGLADAGIEPTAQDLTDMANGTVPTSLRSDSVHWLAAGYTILAKIIFQRLKELEWI
ncbi:hypothetical protein [Pseudomonas sp. PS01297]|uniref:hypothetical protein n=1 Tax=Pseudomonas sp. PS01297 TaxID=2991433 RepID=UPI002499B959|nr:hypothetical protein [Pseudomonas sp. PS01297]